MTTSTIAVEELRIGMHVHLDGGWLSHPFPLSSFRIASAEQIRTLHGLGLPRVRWAPEKSAAATGAADEGVPAAVATASASTAADDAPAAAPSATHRAAETSPAADRHTWLAAERAAAQRCERQHAEAARAWRAISDSVPAQPQQAGRTGQALARGILDKMLSSHDVAIRLVGADMGDRPAAHALNVAVVSLLVGRALGLAPAELLDLGVGALLHDVGKIDVAERHRHAEDGFCAADTAAYRAHVAKGVAQGRRMALSDGALAILAQHHEHTDGSGFPLRATAERLSLGGRIVAIVNRYDNLCNPSSRVPALTPHEAVATLFAQGRARYDTTVLNALIRTMGVYPAGSLVQLTDDRFAVVVGVNAGRPLKPRVLVVGGGDADTGAARDHAELLHLETAPGIGIRRSLVAAKLPPAVLQALDPRPRVSYYFEPLAEQPLPEAAA